MSDWIDGLNKLDTESVIRCWHRYEWMRGGVEEGVLHEVDATEAWGELWVSLTSMCRLAQSLGLTDPLLVLSLSHEHPELSDDALVLEKLIRTVLKSGLQPDGATDMPAVASLVQDFSSRFGEF